MFESVLTCKCLCTKYFIYLSVTKQFNISKTISYITIELQQRRNYSLYIYFWLCLLEKNISSLLREVSKITDLYFTCFLQTQKRVTGFVGYLNCLRLNSKKNHLKIILEMKVRVLYALDE